MECFCTLSKGNSQLQSQGGSKTKKKPRKIQSSISVGSGGSGGNSMISKFSEIRENNDQEGKKLQYEDKKTDGVRINLGLIEVAGEDENSKENCQFQTPVSNGCSTGKNCNSDFSSCTWQSQALEVPKHEEAREIPKRDLKKKVDLDDFEILGILGEGSFGKVYHVIRKEDGVEFALKSISKKSCKDHKERIMREKDILMSIDNPGIIKLYQCFQDSHNLYFLMELAINGELYKYMYNEGCIEYHQAQFMAAEIVAMIEHLQSHNISHRDIKPSNLLFDSNMRLKLADFGSSKTFKISDDSDECNLTTDENKQSGGSGEERNMLNKDENTNRNSYFVGTIDYMSPEIIQGKSCGSECDLWALGVIIYIFFAEYPPFKGEYQDETLQKIEEEQIEFPENFPIVAKDLCMKLLEKDPSRRLGCGRRGMINDIEALKSHPFFYGIDFDNLVYCKSPVPVSDVIRSSLKKRIIEKYRKDDSNDIVHLNCGNTHNTSDSNNLKSKPNSINQFDSSFELSHNVLYEGDISYRTVLFVIFLPIHAIVTDEPALLLLKPSGKLKMKYELKEYYFVPQDKTTFKLIKKGDNEYKYISNKFKISKNATCNAEMLTALLKKFTIN